MARILLFDIETSHNVVYAYQIGRKVSINYDDIKEERKIICICWKWLDEDEVYSVDWGNRQEDKKLLVDFSKEYQKADLIVYQNGDRFDRRYINTRIAFHRLNPLPDMPSFDTLKKFRETFRLNSNRLDYAGQFFGLGKKVENERGLWKKVYDKEPGALDKMLHYCKGDVLLLEAVYKHILPYVKPSVHMGALNGDSMGCRACGSETTKWKGYRAFSQTVFKMRYCSNCGHHWRTNHKA